MPPLSDMPRPDWLAPLSDPRNETILSAAFDVFAEKGIHGATMLEIATRAKVSKETLYARFDSKEGLFYALLAWGAIKSGIHDDKFSDYAVECLVKMMKPESIAAYRIAMAEAERMPELARVFDEFTCKAGRPITTRIGVALAREGLVDIDDIAEFNDNFIGLLRGNLYHDVMIGVTPHPGDEAVAGHARRAMVRLVRAYAAPRRDGFV
ncbi:MAG: TetR family transcriptional regulator [Alphaproteobacteria bacterium]|nr:MAG: TetR family transcriptional regulator [Alphaproteobacteria bacterium]